MSDIRNAFAGLQTATSNGSLVGASSAWPGFTAATGYSIANIKISNWRM
jgi:hypothetical protein